MMSCGQLLDELRFERLERFRELPVRQPVALQRAADPAQVGAGLTDGALLGDGSQADVTSLQNMSCSSSRENIS